MPLWPRSPPARPSRNSGYLLPGAAYLSPRIIWKPIPRPTVEFELSARDIPEIDFGSGLISAEAGLQRRYQIVPEFAPYADATYERIFGDTADFTPAFGEKASGWLHLPGLRCWF
jgi:copper resistance protein B